MTTVVCAQSVDGDAGVLLGPCKDCDREMVTQKAWHARPDLREGRVRAAASGRCNGCYGKHKYHQEDAAIRGRQEIECLIARGLKNSQIVALGFPYESVRGVRDRLDRLAATPHEPADAPNQGGGAR